MASSRHQALFALWAVAMLAATLHASGNRALLQSMHLSC